MNIIIADDEPLARQRLRRLLEESTQSHHVCAEAADGVEAVEACQAHKPDLILMDIRMPRMDGLQAALALSQLAQPPAVVFVTAYDEHALQAFETQALDYLLKPVRQERLQMALEKLQRFSQQQARVLQQRLKEPGQVRDALCATTPSGIQLIPLQSVRYFKADQKYVSVRTDAGEWLIDDALKDLEQEFAPGFLRVHRNALVALAYVQGLERTGDGGQQLVMRDIEDRVLVSRRHLPGVRQVLRQLG